MKYNYRYRLNPSDDVAKRLAWTLDTCRQVYNHFLHRLNRTSNTSAYSEITHLPALKARWPEWKKVHSEVLQRVVQRLYHNLSRLNGLKQNGHRVGRLKWRSPRDYRSFTYSQSGFKLKNTSGRSRLWLSKIGNVPIVLHRDLPEGTEIKEITVKREPTGNWYACLSIETPHNPPSKPERPVRVVGIDVRILKYVHDTDNQAVESLDLSDERARLRHAHHRLSRKEYGSNNWESQRMRMARRQADLKRKRRDFLHKLSAYYAREYDLVAVEDLDTRSLIELPSSSRARTDAAWGTFLRMLEQKCEHEGTHFIEVSPVDTTTECSNCGVKTDKPLWVREHACPACGFETDRDANAARKILNRALTRIGMGCPESTPTETALPVETLVPAKRVVETGSTVRTDDR